MKKTRYTSQLASSDGLTDEVIALADGLSHADLRFLVAVTTSDTIKDAAKEVGLDYKYAVKKHRKLRPVLNEIYPILQREAIKGLTVLVPKATRALGELLDDLGDSKTDTKRKTAEAILDRVVGKPVARVAVKEQSDQEVKIEFKNWTPPTFPTNEN